MGGTTVRLAFVVAVVAALAWACGDDGGGEPKAYFGTVVGYTAPLGANVVAEMALPTGVEQPPVVILLHQFQGSRRQWQPLVQPLLNAGYAVLAPDLRSFGDSTDCAGARCRLDSLDDLAGDVTGALLYLIARNDVDLERIAAIGASVGGNLAYVASGTFEEIDTAISMSPNANPSGGALLGRNNPDFLPHSIMFMADEAEAPDARKLAENVDDPVAVKVYPGGEAHGVELLDNSQAVQDILDWLQQTL